LWPGLGVQRHAPRLAARQRGIFGLRLNQRSGRARSYVSLEGFSRGRPWVRFASTPRPQVPLPIPALRTPPEGALDFGSGWAQHNYAISEVNGYFALGE
jgi:hypothetical protein